jgi:hypothetical protein
VTAQRPHILRNDLPGIASLVAAAGVTSATHSTLPLATLGGAPWVLGIIALMRTTRPR